MFAQQKKNHMFLKFLSWIDVDIWSDVSDPLCCWKCSTYPNPAASMNRIDSKHQDGYKSQLFQSLSKGLRMFDLLDINKGSGFNGVWRGSVYGHIPETCFLAVCFLLVSSIVFTHSRKAGRVPMKRFDNTDAFTAYSECRRMFPFVCFSCHVSFLVIMCTTRSDKIMTKLFRISASGDVFVYVIQRKVVPVIGPAYYF